ncbi:ABC transporter permease [Acidimicrobiia bacterium EGI L10123]|uniref:MlaE family ABC transporter permease n=1 Tax=Salinilacustrithrix flava TaxID=2957203 RepID=UPI003D7C2995|nr:ABC transporter permease [Acidimicrobiia bacterium EGI L10123]
MATVAAPSNPFARTARTLRRWPRSVSGSITQVGDFVLFSGRAIASVFSELLLRRRFLREVARQVSDVVSGAGAFVVGGGMVFVVAAMSLATGGTLGVQAYEGLRTIGAESLTGIVTSLGNVREITPMIAGIALAAQVGSSFTAELGAKRISEEIDALSVMSIPPIAYLVSTRILAALIAIIPLYLVSLFASFAASELVTVRVLGLAQGVYDYYFNLFLPPIDLLYSLIKIVVFAMLVVLIHCWYGYNASGGPAGVGVAVGRAIRTSMMTIVVVNLLLSFLFWGTTTTASLTG